MKSEKWRVSEFFLIVIASVVAKQSKLRSPRHYIPRDDYYDLLFSGAFALVD